MALLDDAPRCGRHVCIMLPGSVPGANQNASSGVSAVGIVAAVTVAIAAVTVAVAAVDMRAVTSPSARPPATVVVVAAQAALGVACRPALEMATATLNCSINTVEA
jgi:hypothetical protein